MVVPWAHVVPIPGTVGLGKTGIKEAKVAQFETGFAQLLKNPGMHRKKVSMGSWHSILKCHIIFHALTGIYHLRLGSYCLARLSCAVCASHSAAPPTAEHQQDTRTASPHEGQGRLRW